MLLSKQMSNKQGMCLMFALAEVSACCFSNSSLPSYLHLNKIQHKLLYIK